MNDANSLPALEPGIAAWLDARAADTELCLVDAGQPLRWDDLVRQVQALSGGLAAIGIRPGDRVGLWLPNRTAWLLTMFACARIGAIAVSINTRFRSAEVGDLIQRSGARALVCWPGFHAIDFAGILAQCGDEALRALETVVVYAEGGDPVPQRVAGKPARAFADLLAHAPGAVPAGVGGESPCIMFTTSGTTKAPKMVLHKQSTVLSHARNVARQYALDSASRFILVPPFCGVYGFCSAMAALSARSRLVLEPVWDPRRYAQLVREHGVTHLTASNEALAQLLDAGEGPRPFPSLRLVVQANLNPAHADIALRAEACGVTAVGLYGSSEVQALFSHCAPSEPLARRGRAGGVPASALARVRTRDTETGRLCAAGEPGELEILAPESRFVEYFGNPQATAEAFTADGWFRTGDLALIEPDGSFSYLARMGDSLRLGGFLVSPAEIEATVQECPGVDSCQVVGARLKDGVKPVAFVLARAGQSVDEAGVIAHVAARLAKYKVPVRVLTLAEFPTTASANGTKVQKNKLRDLAEASLGA